jgi:hypothetical protein
MTLKELAAELTAVRTELKRINALKTSLAARQKDLENDLMDALTENGMTSVKIDGNTFGQTIAHKPVVEDWDMFYAYILQTGSVHMLHKSATQSAILELMEAGEEVPGVAMRDVASVYYK